MTDKYDMDPHEAGASDEAGSTTESWQDDHPPVDDFSDAGEESATVSEENSSLSQEDEADLEPRKSSILLPLAAGVGGLLILSGIMYWQFGHSSTPVSMTPVPVHSAQASAPKPATQDTGVPVTSSPVNIPVAQSAMSPLTTDVAPKGPLTLAQNNSSATVTTPSNVTTALPPSLPPPSSVMSASAVPLAAPVPEALHPVSASVPAPVMVPVSPVSPTPAPATTPSVNTVSASDQQLDTRLSNLSARIDELKKKLDQTGQELSQINTAPGTAAGTVSIEDRLTKIEQQLAQAEHSTPSLATPATADQTPEGMTSLEKEPAVAAPQEKPHKELKAKHHETRATKTKRSSKKSGKTRATSSRTKWILRAATPDEAWVAKDASSTELHHVRVGENLPGIGRVLDIQQSGDNWIVKGTHGTVR